jgi:hypothetical protein
MHMTRVHANDIEMLNTRFDSPSRAKITLRVDKLRSDILNGSPLDSLYPAQYDNELLERMHHMFTTASKNVDVRVLVDIAIEMSKQELHIEMNEDEDVTLALVREKEYVFFDSTRMCELVRDRKFNMLNYVVQPPHPDQSSLAEAAKAAKVDGNDLARASVEFEIALLGYQVYCMGIPVARAALQRATGKTLIHARLTAVLASVDMDNTIIARMLENRRGETGTHSMQQDSHTAHAPAAAAATVHAPTAAHTAAAVPVQAAAAAAATAAAGSVEDATVAAVLRRTGFRVSTNIADKISAYMNHSGYVPTRTANDATILAMEAQIHMDDDDSAAAASSDVPDGHYGPDRHERTSHRVRRIDFIRSARRRDADPTPAPAPAPAPTRVRPRIYASPRV